MSEISNARVRALIAQEAAFELARRDFSHFVSLTMPSYIMEPFHLSLCRRLQLFYDAVSAGESPRLMIFAPPQHGKSELGSRRFPAWLLGQEPDWNLIATSYASDLAVLMNRDVQRIMDSSVYRRVFPQTLLASRSGIYQRSTDLFEVVGRKGSYRSAGVGGGITGMGGRVLIIDDPFKDRASADSSLIRQNIYDWYTSTLRTRMRAKGGILLIMTRWHEDDLAGRLLALAEEDKQADQWEVFRYQALAARDEPFRKEGAPLCPSRFDLEDLIRVKASLPARDWEALYQQNPRPSDGAVFLEHWIRYYRRNELPENFDKMCQSWDMSFKDTKGSDFVSGGVWGKKGANTYLLDMEYGRYDYVGTVARLKALTARWPQVGPKYIENKANGPAIIASMKNEIPGIIPVEPKDSKLARAWAVTPYFEAGNIWLPHPSEALWVKDFVAELTGFPHAAHDDRVDMTTQALSRLYPVKRPVVFTQEMLDALKR